jgi:two-component system, OmpR family, sensor kinase
MGDKASRTALEEVRRRNAELMEAVAARDTFIAVAAHELRTR